MPQLQGTSQPVSVPKRRKRREFPRRYPSVVNYSITTAMAHAIERNCPATGPFTQADFLRMVLHGYLTGNDPLYQREVANGGAAPV
jgi:hypothetical protein